MQLTFRDVYLDFFKGKKALILKQRSGMPLVFNNGYFHLQTGESVATLSQKMQKELNKKQEQGYQVQSATINFIVAWRGENDTEESAVLLPEITLRKEDNR